MTSATELRLATPALQLAALAWGDPQAPLLLALHGWLDNAASFARLAPLLAGTYRVIALDLPGHGHSQHLPAGLAYHYLDHVRAAIAVIDGLGRGRLSLVGHSLGAGVASLVAAARPAQIDRLWLIEGLGPPGDEGSDTLTRWREAMTPASAARPLRRFIDIEQALRARLLASGLPAAQARPIVERGLLSCEGGWQWRSDPRLTRTSPIRMAEMQVQALLHGIQAPTALLLAEPATAYLADEAMRQRIACVPTIEVSHLPGGHHLQLQHPQAVADWLLARRSSAARRGP